MNLVNLYDKLEGLVGRLPESLQSPILKEVRPLKTLFLQQRPARLLLLGDRAASRSGLVNALFKATVAKPEEDHLQEAAWQLFARNGRVRVLDARRPAAVSTLRRALATEGPDVLVYLHTGTEAPAADDLEHAAEVIRAVHEKQPEVKPKLVAVTTAPTGHDAYAGVRVLEQALHSATLPKTEVAGVFALSAGPAEVEQLATVLAEEVSEEAQLELVRLASLKEMQRKMATTVVKSVSAISGAIGAQPIPLADFPILTSLQAGMVAGVMYISGRELSTKLAGEWLGALGANLGAALVMREGARAVLKIVPVWGDFVAGGIAAAGTYGIGKAAIGYFIDGVTLQGAKALLKKKERTPPELVG